MGSRLSDSSRVALAVNLMIIGEEIAHTNRHDGLCDLLQTDGGSSELVVV